MSISSDPRLRLLLTLHLLSLLPTNLAAGILNPPPPHPIIHLALFLVSSSHRGRSLLVPSPKHNPIVDLTTRCSCSLLSTSIPTLYDLDPLVLEGTRITTTGVPVVDDPGENENNAVPQTQYLISPAPESYHLIERRCAHAIKDYYLSCCYILDHKQLGTASDHDLLQTFYWDMEALAQFLVKPGYRLELFPVLEEKEDVSFQGGGGGGGRRLSWRWNITVQDANEKLLIHRRGYDDVRPQDPDPIGRTLPTSSSSHPRNNNNTNRRELYQSSTALEIAKLALKTSEYGASPIQMEEIICQFKKRLCLTLGSDLRGVTSAEAAFSLAISGISKSHDIFDALVKIGIHELRRSGSRSSFQPKYILQMVEKFAASVNNDSMYAVELYHLAGMYLGDKGYRNSELISHLLHGSFGLHSSRPLLWLWRYSARQKKTSSFLPMKHVMDENGNGGNIDIENSMNIIVWEDHFVDTNKGLVVDIGCGFGVCLLNLVRQQSIRENNNIQGVLTTDDLSHLKWSEYNFAGADLNPQLIGYANGVTSRFPSSEQNRLHFFSCSAQDILHNLFMYRGKIECIMIHFPSPYRLPLFDDDCNDDDKGKERSGGNSQLPDHGKDGFLVTPRVAKMISTLLQNNPQARLIFQTKCEDVAIHVKNLLLSTGTLEIVPCCHPVKSVEDFYAASGRRPKRLDLWLDSTPEAERAEGEFWSSKAIMPTLARPETEIQCEHDHTVVHRCLFRSIQDRKP